MKKYRKIFNTSNNIKYIMLILSLNPNFLKYGTECLHILNFKI